LDIDVLPMCFPDACIKQLRFVFLHHCKDAVAIQFISSVRERRRRRIAQKVEGTGDAGRETTIEIRVFKGIENHGCPRLLTQVPEPSCQISRLKMGTSAFSRSMI